MLNPFPIQFLALLAYALLRVIVGAILIYLAGTHIKKRQELAHMLTFPWFPYGLFGIWVLAFTELLVGTMFILGLYTQIAALITIILSLKMIVFHKDFASIYTPGKMFYLLLFAASLSLFITGAGAFAFDLPI